MPDIWGAMGALGYRGRDRRVTNLDWSDLLDGHSHIFDEEIMGLVGSTLPMNLYIETAHV